MSFSLMHREPGKVLVSFGKRTRATIYGSERELDFAEKTIVNAFEAAEKASGYSLRTGEAFSGCQHGRLQDIGPRQVELYYMASRRDGGAPTGLGTEPGNALLEKADQLEADLVRRQRREAGYGAIDRYRERAAKEAAKADSADADREFRTSPAFVKRQMQAVLDVLGVFWDVSAPRSEFEDALRRLRRVEALELDRFDEELNAYRQRERTRIETESSAIEQARQRLDRRAATLADEPQNDASNAAARLEAEHKANLDRIEADYQASKAALQLQREQSQREHDAQFGLPATGQ